MKQKKKFILITLSVITILLLLGFGTTRCYLSSKYKKIAERMRTDYKDIPNQQQLPLSFYLTFGYFPRSMDEALDFYHREVRPDVPKEHIRAQQRLQDPFSRDSCEIQYVPLYDYETKKPVSFILLSAGVDGKMDNKITPSDTLYLNNWWAKLDVYNYEEAVLLQDYWIINYITLCHSYDNDICHSSTHTEDATQGLTQFGREVVKEMNRLGIMIDISHASEGTFWDVIKYSTQPIIASHSSSRTLCDHDRNLTDEQLRALAKNGGVAQLCLLDTYINKTPKAASVCDAVEHLDHMIKVAGIDHVGIGTDFDGGGGLQGCKGDNDLINLTIKMIEKGYTEEDLRKIWGGNLLRVMKQVQEAPLFSLKKRR